ncbi:hypothetical protein MAR_007374 [Mya arenaria]|uniref:Uncharacterized protein n=1 Tax=Mya arenaria TaxID=6604 RepID=A0ABY7DFP2_MYAAR|nr:hypothetical protein MAR_007374 [Mya arenaria]
MDFRFLANTLFACLSGRFGRCRP